MSITLTISELLARKHSALPDPESYRVTNMSVDFDAESRVVSGVTLTLKSKQSDKIRRFLFENVRLAPFGPIQISDSVGLGITIIDARYRGWDKTNIEVVSNDEEMPELFWAESVVEVT